MNVSSARCSTSERGESPLPYRDGPVEEDGFITVIATGWARPLPCPDPDRIESEADQESVGPV